MALLVRLIDLVEDAAVGEVRLLRLLPAAERLSMVTSFIFGNCAAYCLATDGEARPEVVAGAMISCAFGRVEILEIGLRDGARALLVDDLSTTATGGSARMLSDGRDDLELVRAELVRRPGTPRSPRRSARRRCRARRKSSSSRARRNRAPARSCRAWRRSRFGRSPRCRRAALSA